MNPEIQGRDIFNIPDTATHQQPVPLALAYLPTKNISTPMLMLKGAEDVPTSIGQGREFCSAFKKRNVTAQMSIYPRSEYFPVEPKLQRDM